MLPQSRAYSRTLSLRLMSRCACVMRDLLSTIGLCPFVKRSRESQTRDDLRGNHGRIAGARRRRALGYGCRGRVGVACEESLGRNPHHRDAGLTGSMGGPASSRASSGQAHGCSRHPARPTTAARSRLKYRAVRQTFDRSIDTPPPSGVTSYSQGGVSGKGAGGMTPSCDP